MSDNSDLIHDLIQANEIDYANILSELELEPMLQHFMNLLLLGDDTEIAAKGLKVAVDKYIEDNIKENGVEWVKFSEMRIRTRSQRRRFDEKLQVAMEVPMQNGLAGFDKEDIR